MAKKRASIDDLIAAADGGDPKAQAAVQDLMAEAFEQYGAEGLDELAATPNRMGRRTNAKVLVDHYQAGGFQTMLDQAVKPGEPGGLPVELTKDDWADAYNALGDLFSYIFDLPGLGAGYLKNFALYAYGWGKKYFRVGAAWVHHSLLIYKGAAGIADQFRRSKAWRAQRDQDAREKVKHGGENPKAG